MTGRIQVCAGTSGISAGALEVYDAFKTHLKQQKLSDSFTVVKTGDRGLFRDVLVDIIFDDNTKIIYEYVTVDDVEHIVVEHLKNGEPYKKRIVGKDYEQFFKDQKRIVLKNCGEIDPENINEYLEREGYQAAQKALAMKPQEIIDIMKESGLRGRGGAGFPTGLKWQFCHNATGDQKYIICNADEGDPGAFMDRSLLEGDPHAVIEGMIIGAYAIGATEGYVYCRAEYPLALRILRTAIEQAEKNGYLGKNIFGTTFSFHLHVKEGAGAFVCGEETALMASIEGKRGMPHPRPPYPSK